MQVRNSTGSGRTQCPVCITESLKTIDLHTLVFQLVKIGVKSGPCYFILMDSLSSERQRFFTCDMALCSYSIISMPLLRFFIHSPILSIFCYKSFNIFIIISLKSFSANFYIWDIYWYAFVDFFNDNHENYVLHFSASLHELVISNYTPRHLRCLVYALDYVTSSILNFVPAGS